jgi:hypothetical protein
VTNVDINYVRQYNPHTVALFNLIKDGTSTFS